MSMLRKYFAEGLLLPIIFLFVTLPTYADIRVIDLRCEYQTNPLGIDVEKPGLSWKLESEQRNQRQTAYRILVSDRSELLQTDKGNIWDSGKVNSSNTIQVTFQGQPLESRRRYFWKVQVWDQTDRSSQWSSPNQWEMALLDPNDWRAVWIENPRSLPQKDEDFYQDNPAPQFRKAFIAQENVRSARLYISGLGYYEASLNGRRVGDRQLDPAWTNYAKRVFYATYDVTDLLNGDHRNVIGVTLGNGWFNPLPMRMWGRRNIRENLPVGRPRMIAQIEIVYKDGSRSVIASGADWKTTSGPCLRNDVYIGEIYDARREIPGWQDPGFDDGNWESAVVSDSPLKLAAASLPPIRITREIKPVSMKHQASGVVIYDFGQNMAGWVRLRLNTLSGERVTLRYGELLDADGNLNPMTSVCGQIKGPSVGGPGAPPIAWQEDVYIAKGNGTEYYQPQFTFHGFRYVEVSGCSGKLDTDSILGLHLNTDIAEVGQFSCSNDLFNRIQENTCRTFLNNIFSVQSDCPHREKFGYGGDIAVSCDAFMMNYDMAEFYANTVRLFENAARPDGMLTDTAPFVGIQYCGPGWAMTHPLLTCKLYQYYGNQRIVMEQYPVAQRWLSLVQKKYPDGIIKQGLSDHEGLEERPAPVMVTPLYCQCIKLLENLATQSGHDQDAADYRDLYESVRQRYLEQFYDPNTGQVGPATQGSQSFALFSGLLSEESQQPKALHQLLNQIDKRQQHLSTGIFGTKYLLSVLSRNGYADRAYQIVNQKTYPGWGYMIEKGATTLWEHWAYSDNTFSHNHPMFGSVSEWFYQWLGGIQPAPEAAGFDRIWIRPRVVSGLEWVRCSYNSIRGPIQSNWKHDGQTLTLDIAIPANTSALVFLPQARIEDIKESGRSIGASPDMEWVSQSPEPMLKIGSGNYRFQVPANQF